LAIIASRALIGMHAPPVRVEVQLANGLPSFTLVGLADTEVKEARERVRAALQQSGFAFPHNKRVTVNLAPADLPKESGRFDLPIALGILAAAGVLDAQRLAACEFAGELSLAGELRPVRGAIALALAARGDGGTGRALVLPRASAELAARVGGLRVLGADTLAQVAAAMLPDAEPLPRLEAPPLGAAVDPAEARAAPDLADVRGQTLAKRALELAAAGGHSLLMVGPPGTGKSMLAQRLPGLLPPMSDEEALESAALRGLAGSSADALGDSGAHGVGHAGGMNGTSSTGYGRRPFRSPHHSASAAALVGGGSVPRPGEISLAHGGVLFLDELAEFAREALEALREPLEAGRITIARAARRAEFPARFQLVAAMNPCPCGWLGAGGVRNCRCTPDAVARYQGRLSGPLLDRIDLQVEVAAMRADEVLAPASGPSSAEVAARVAAGRARQERRQGVLNAQLPAAQVQAMARLSPAATEFLHGAAARLAFSGRRLHRTLRVARTVADLAGMEAVQVPHLAEALQLQRALPAQ
jgi:magnesium chelatase family protein